MTDIKTNANDTKTMSQQAFRNSDRFLLYITIFYCVLIIKLNKINENNCDLICYYCKYSTEEINLFKAYL